MLRRRWIPRASTRARGATWGCPRGERAGWRPGRFDSVTGAGRLPALRQGRPGHRRQERSVRRYVPMCGGRGLCEAGAFAWEALGGPTAGSWPWLLAGRRNRGRLGELLAASEKLGFVAETEEGWFSATDAPLAHTPARKSSKGKSKSTRRDDDDDVSFRLDRLEGILLQLTEVWATCHNMGKARTLSLGASPRRQVSGARHKGRERHLPARAAHWRPSRPRSAGRRCPKAFAGRRGPAARTSAQKRQTRRQRRQKRAGGRRPTIPSAL